MRAEHVRRGRGARAGRGTIGAAEELRKGWSETLENPSPSLFRFPQACMLPPVQAVNCSNGLVANAQECKA